MLRCADGSYYVGHTDNLERRLAKHQSGEFGGYTSNRLPVSLAWSQEFPARDEALRSELQIKSWSRAKKVALIRGDWGELKKLSRGRNRCERRSGPSTPRSPLSR
jgi:predicted GIY-YIG superfamily endonuclease